MRIRRTQPPVACPVPLAELARAAAAVSRGGRFREALEQEVSRYLDVRTVRAVSSGKAALTLALRALHRLSGRRKVVVPAYTCYSVPSAVAAADLEVVPCDVADGTFDYDYAQLEALLRADVLCVLSVHLFGIPADTARLAQMCSGTGIHVVEDAAQAFGGESRGRRLGTLGDVAIFSLGRGKNVTCGAGGLVATDSDAIAAELAHVTRDLQSPGTADDAATFAALSALALFIHPRLYWCPAGLPFLRLGETIFHEDFPVRRLSDFQALLMQGWRGRLDALNAGRLRTSNFYAARINGVSHVGRGFPCLRYPVLLGGEADRVRLLEEWNGAALGMSRMYPATVAAIRQLPQLAGRRFPRAEAIAASLVTLPTHPLLTREDLADICALVSRAGGRYAVRARAAS